MKKRVIIMGAAGRDFHNFNVYFKGNENYEVVAFTSSQIEGIDQRVYPTGNKDIPIYPEKELPHLIQNLNPDQVILAYSDLSHQEVMTKASLVLSLGCDFKLMGGKTTMIDSIRPVIAVTAVRTGCGKSGVSLTIAKMIKHRGLEVVVLRHPMPYGNLVEQSCQRFSCIEDLKNCTIEEREEYEQYIAENIIVYAGVDYKKILYSAEKEADVIIWDGGNNDIPFIKPDYHIVLVDPLRAGNELTYYPGQVNLRMADMIIINKINSASKDQISQIYNNIEPFINNKIVIESRSEVIVDKPELINEKSVVIIEDAPSVTHGGLLFGAGYIAAIKYNSTIIEPKNYAVGTIKDIYNKYNNIKYILPSMGYNNKQISDLKETVNNIPCECIILATPISSILFDKPIVRVSYTFIPESRFYKILDRMILKLYKW